MRDPEGYSLSRRALIAGAASAAASVAASVAANLAACGPALGQARSEAEVVIVGAGAAGIAAARSLAAAGRSYILIEATGQPGGRARTDTALYGVPFDLGARRLHLPGGAGMAAAAKADGIALYPAPRGARLYVGGKEAPDTDYEEFIATVRRADRAIGAAGDAGRDLPAARVLPPDLGPFGPSADFVLGPFTCAKPLVEVSTVDFARADAREADLLCLSGMGSVVAKLAQPLTIRFDTVATSVELGGRLVRVNTNRGTLSGRAVILAVPPSLIAAGKLKVLPALPARPRLAVERITLGAFERIAFALPGNPIGLDPDELVHVKSEGPRAFALSARMGGSDLYCLDVGGPLAAELANGSDAAAEAFVWEALERQFGRDVAARARKVRRTRWMREPYALGAISCALPGAGNLRRAFTEVVGGRLILAGEHAHETLWGTLAGAWASGERAAGQALRLLGAGSAG